MNLVVPEGIKFAAKAGLSLLVPSLLFSVVSGDFWPLCLMAANEALGALLGLLLFKQARGGVLSCVPLRRVADRGAAVSKKDEAAAPVLKKAA